jgi:type II secretion system protein G
MMFGYKNKKRGFTLIELLVVISIIGMLSSIVLSSLNDARAKARDARRMSDIKQIQNALELYRVDHGSYPVVYPTSPSYAMTNSNSGSYSGRWNNTTTGLKILETKKYITQLPTDPKPSTGYGLTWSHGDAYGYTYYAPYNTTGTLWNGCPADGSVYMLAYRLEKNKSPNPKISPITNCTTGAVINISTSATNNIRNGLITTGMAK